MRKRGGHKLIQQLVLAGVVAAGAADAAAQAYPSRPIRYIVPSSAGSGNDFIARLMGADMSQSLGQQIIVDNRAGAGGNIAGELAATAAPDGYTMFQVSSTIAINQTLYPKLPYNLVRDFAPVTLLAIQPNLVVVHSALPVNSIADLIKVAKARPGGLNYSSAGLGSNSFLATELLNTLAGIKLVHVPYKGGGPAISATAAGETSLMIGPMATSAPHIQQGKLRGIAVSSSKRLPDFPQYPAVAETVPGYVFDNWYGLTVPVKTPRAVIPVLQRAATEALNKPAIHKQLANVGFIVSTGEPAEFGTFLKNEIAKMGNIVRQTGTKVD
jgi:tripartite-type tricarboxylate transporter receptor subunit TctC